MRTGPASREYRLELRDAHLADQDIEAATERFGTARAREMALKSPLPASPRGQTIDRAAMEQRRNRVCRRPRLISAGPELLIGQVDPGPDHDHLGRLQHREPCRVADLGRPCLLVSIDGQDVELALEESAPSVRMSMSSCMNCTPFTSTR